MSAAAGSQSIRQLKRSMRKHMAAALASVPSDVVASQSKSITEHVLRHPAFASAESVSVYVSLAAGEVRTEELCRATLLQGKRLYVPHFSSSSSSFQEDMRMLRVRDWNEYESMAMNRWGIREPDFASEDALAVESGGAGLDLIIVPGVAFDTFGGRLGHGKGYYDRYIRYSSKMMNERAKPSPLTIALALKEQIVAAPNRVPSDENDLNMDLILTEDGVMLLL